MNGLIAVNPDTSVPTEAGRRAAWLEDRRSCITGTDVAAILGLSRFSSPIQVYLDKKGLAQTTENEAMRWGKRLERPILEAYAETVGHPIAFADSYTLHRVPDFNLLGASLDARWLDGDLRPVDAKNVRHKTADWGDPGTDTFPVYYQTQLVVQMMATGAPFGDLAPLFSGQELAVYTMERDLETEAVIKERVAAWWERHIVGDLPPDVDGSDSATDYLRRKFARASDLTREATPEVLEWIRHRQEADAELKDAEARKAEAENLIKAFLGEAQAIPGLLTWKNNKDSEAMDAKAYASELERHLLQSGMDGAAIKAIRAAYTTIKPGARVLRFTASK